MTPRVTAVHSSATHTFSKPSLVQVRVLAGLGVEGDAHAGVTVKHRSRVAADPTQPNLRQVHLLMAELLDELEVRPGALGENITTRDLDLLALSAGTVLQLGEDVQVRVTGLRNPCVQIEAFRRGLLKQVVGRAADGEVERRAGIMAVALTGGVVRPGDPVRVQAPSVFVSLQRV